MILDFLKPYLAVVEAGIVLALVTIAAYGGWHERDIRAQLDHAQYLAAQAQETATAATQLSQARADALTAASDYAKKAAALKPQFEVIHEKAAPILLALTSCPVPLDAVSVLNAAALWADSADGTSGALPAPNGAGAPAKGPPAPHGGGPDAARLGSVPVGGELPAKAAHSP